MFHKHDATDLPPVNPLDNDDMAKLTSWADVVAGLPIVNHPATEASPDVIAKAEEQMKRLDECLGPMPKCPAMERVTAHLLIGGLVLGHKPSGQLARVIMETGIEALKQPVGDQVKDSPAHVASTAAVLFAEVMVANFGIDTRLAAILAKQAYRAVATVHGIKQDPCGHDHSKGDHGL